MFPFYSCPGNISAPKRCPAGTFNLYTAKSSITDCKVKHTCGFKKKKKQPSVIHLNVKKLEYFVLSTENKLYIFIFTTIFFHCMKSTKKTTLTITFPGFIAKHRNKLWWLFTALYFIVIAFPHCLLSYVSALFSRSDQFRGQSGL